MGVFDVMRESLLLLASVFLLLIGRVTADNNVVELDANNFDAYIENNPIVLVEFYAPWCGHCKALAPEYEAAAQILKDDKVKLTKVDAADEKNQRLAATHDVQGFPTLKLFKNDHDVSVIGFFDDKNREEFKAFETAANEVSDVHFGHVFDNGIRKLMRAEKKFHDCLQKVRRKDGGL